MDVGKGREQERKLEGGGLSIAAPQPLILTFSRQREKELDAIICLSKCHSDTSDRWQAGMTNFLVSGLK
jgi:hypothetical protein